MKIVRRCGCIGVSFCSATSTRSARPAKRSASSIATPGAVRACGSPCCEGSFGRVCVRQISRDLSLCRASASGFKTKASYTRLSERASSSAKDKDKFRVAPIPTTHNMSNNARHPHTHNIGVTRDQLVKTWTSTHARTCQNRRNNACALSSLGSTFALQYLPTIFGPTGSHGIALKLFWLSCFCFSLCTTETTLGFDRSGGQF